GHSLGGALATLAAWRLKRKAIKIHQVFTFGAPMFCNIEAVEQYNLRLANRIHRFVNDRDVVPLLPISDVLANEYAHVGAEQTLTSDEADGSSREILRHLEEAVGLLAGGGSLGPLRPLLGHALTLRLSAH